MSKGLEGTKTKKVCDDLEDTSRVVFFFGVLALAGAIYGAVKLPNNLAGVLIASGVMVAVISYVVSVLFRGLSHCLELLAYMYEDMPDQKEEA